MKNQTIILALCLCLISIMLPVTAAAATVNVSTTSQLITAISNAAPGTTIVLDDGTYTNGSAISINGKNGTSANLITIKAANRGKAVISGGASFNITNSSYITIDGLAFTNTGKSAVVINSSNNIRITRSKFALKEDGTTLKWLVLTGTAHHNQIDRNEFGPRRDLGQMISMDGTNGQVVQNNTIQLNYFHDSAPQAENGGETIRVGLSGLSMSDGNNIIQRNLFVNCDAENEIISVKSGHNTVRYNTFRNNHGQVTARHGNNNSFYGNFFFGDGSKAGVGGFRIYGTDHKIYNNYMEKLTDNAIQLDSGDFDGGPDSTEYTSSDLTKHWREYRVQVTNNTIVNSTTGVIIGGTHPYAPVDNRVANNIVKNTTGTLYNEKMTTNTVLEGNIGYGSTIDNVSRSSSEIRNIDPKFTTVSGLQKLASSSPAIDGSKGSYAFVTDDMDGQARSNNDVGADEYSTASIVRAPLTTSDVGVNAP
ncbi:polysaccharide lyase 6 family protein [Paenibacillus hamazuiensis]|uniref:polysaccharide lyase 6 family protein n=1 Tax=Paenibacillus hamazuiensis TaxID=2936508 RepID=UPI00200C88B9|nr:polysaccharide lyase 6 family protein [Paenibacillus hamazuiensis]